MIRTSTPSLNLAAIALAIGIAAPAAAQQPEDGTSDETAPGWKRQFQQVDVDKIDPNDLPDPDESVLPSALSKKSALPRPTSLETLRKSADEIGELVVGVVVVPRSNSPLKQTPVVVQGEAIWISGEENGANPLLLTNAHYLLDAESVFVRPTPKKKTGALPTAPRRKLRQMSLGADVKSVLNDPNLIEVEVANVDKHRNLATLTVAKGKMKLPERGLAFYPIEDEAVSSVYGFSHQMGSALVVTRFLAPKGKRDELEYYLHTTFPVILGAPIVSADGRVIATTAMRHPADQDRTLVIPPRALRTYVDKVQQSLEAQKEKRDGEQ